MTKPTYEKPTATNVLNGKKQTNKQTKNTQTKTLNNHSQDYFEDERVGFTEAFSSKSNGYRKCSAV